MSLEAQLRRDLARLRELTAKRRTEPAASGPPINWDVLCGAVPLEALPPGEQRDLHLRLRVPRGIVDPVDEAIARSLAKPED
jgi:hypothetical protein